MKNLEIKARYAELDLARQRARSLGARDTGVSRDVDTYFRVPQGRLKLRRTEGSPHGTLIYYDRPDLTESRYSEYYLAPVHDPEVTRALLDGALDTFVTVTKRPGTCFCTARRASTSTRSRGWGASSSSKLSSGGRLKKKLTPSTS